MSEAIQSQDWNIYKKKRIATDLYYCYGEIDYKINAGLATATELYIKRYSKKYAFIYPKYRCSKRGSPLGLPK